jgi:predicted Rossmann fold nucleotide-binding protein DprA/Smf involved in DNA uptake
MADFLEQKKREIAKRMDELRPSVEEFQRLEGALRALDGVGSGGGGGGGARSTTSRRTRGASTGTGRRGRPRGSGSRAQETLALVQQTPGITIPELAQKMGIKQNYLYRVLPGLEQDGKVRKEGRGWHPKAA